MRFAILIVLALAVPAMGQVSPDEANARLKVRQESERAEATQPAKITNAELEAMKKDLAKLQKRVSELLKENTTLRERIEQVTSALSATTTKPADKPTDKEWSQKVSAAIQEGKILKGMTEAEAWRSAVNSLNALAMQHRNDELARGGRAIDGGLGNAPGLPGQSTSPPRISESRGEAVDGETTVTWSNSFGSITVLLQNEKVVAFNEIR